MLCPVVTSSPREEKTFLPALWCWPLGSDFWLKAARLGPGPEPKMNDR